MNDLRKGDKARIYQSPLCNDDFEGIGTLVEFQGSEVEWGTEDWLVSFPGDPGPYFRRIKAYHKVNKGVAV